MRRAQQEDVARARHAARQRVHGVANQHPTQRMTDEDIRVARRQARNPDDEAAPDRREILGADHVAEGSCRQAGPAQLPQQRPARQRRAPHAMNKKCLH